MLKHSKVLELLFFVFLAERAYPLTDAHQPPFWPGAEAGSRRLHSAETSLRTKNKKTKKDIPLPPPPPPQKKLHKGDHRGRNFTGKPAALTSVSGDKCPL